MKNVVYFTILLILHVSTTTWIKTMTYKHRDVRPVRSVRWSVLSQAREGSELSHCCRCLAKDKRVR